MTEDKTVEKIKDNLLYLNSAGDADIENIKSIVCTFYRNGHCPDCKGCTQPEDKVLECKGEYVSKIESRPMDKWAAEFDVALSRKKQKVHEVVGMGLACNQCYMSDSCPLYEPNTLCAIDWEEESDGPLTPKKVIEKLIQIQFQRVNRAAKIEQLDGGVPDQNMSTEIDRLTDLTRTLNDFNLDKFSLKIEGTASNNGNGILSQLFGKKPAADNNLIEDTPFTDAVVMPSSVNVKKGR